MSDEPGTVADLIRTATEAVIDFRLGLGARPVARPVDRDALVAALGGPLPVDAAAPDLLINELVEAVEPGLVATAGPRFFGFVVGGSLPAATAADLLAVGWDQLAFNATTSPAASVVEQVAGGWLTSLLGLPATASVGFGTGAQSANTVGLAAGRHRVLDAAGWDVELDGLAGAPRLRVVASAERHATVDRSLRLLGLGAGRVAEVAAGPQGAIDIDDLGRVLEREPDALHFKEMPGHVAIHAHCHAKSLVKTGFMARLAARLPGRTAVLLDTGCCGMAGAFGALERKYDLSLKVAAPLVQQVNAQPASSVIVASGTSCRHQLEHLTPVHPKHMAELLADAL